VARGVVLAAFRLLRCHPFGGFGFDPVPLRADEPEAERSGRHAAPIEDATASVLEKAEIETFEPEEVVTA
jgi:hypothetical protein